MNERTPHGKLRNAAMMSALIMSSGLPLMSAARHNEVKREAQSDLESIEKARLKRERKQNRNNL